MTATKIALCGECGEQLNLDDPHVQECAHDAEFVGDVSEAYTCAFTHTVLSRTNCTRTPCEHIVDGVALQEWLRNNDTCPICQTRIRWTQCKPPLVVRGLIGELEMRCVYAASGCEWSGRMDRMRAHVLDECSHAQVQQGVARGNGGLGGSVLAQRAAEQWTEVTKSLTPLQRVRLVQAAAVLLALAYVAMRTRLHECTQATIHYAIDACALAVLCMCLQYLSGSWDEWTRKERAKNALKAFAKAVGAYLLLNVLRVWIKACVPLAFDLSTFGTCAGLAIFSFKLNRELHQA